MNYRETDPEFAERFEHFAFEEVPHEEGQQLDEVTRYAIGSYVDEIFEDHKVTW